MTRTAAFKWSGATALRPTSTFSQSTPRAVKSCHHVANSLNQLGGLTAACVRSRTHALSLKCVARRPDLTEERRSLIPSGAQAEHSQAHLNPSSGARIPHDVRGKGGEAAGHDIRRELRILVQAFLLHPGDTTAEKINESAPSLRRSWKRTAQRTQARRPPHPDAPRPPPVPQFIGPSSSPCSSPCPCRLPPSDSPDPLAPRVE